MHLGNVSKNLSVAFLLIFPLSSRISCWDWQASIETLHELVAALSPSPFNWWIMLEGLFKDYSVKLLSFLITCGHIPDLPLTECRILGLLMQADISILP